MGLLLLVLLLLILFGVIGISSHLFWIAAVIALAVLIVMLASNGGSYLRR